MNIALIITAAGKGERFGGSVPKHLVLIQGVPLIVHTCRAFSSDSHRDTINRFSMDTAITFSEKIMTVSKEHRKETQAVVDAHRLPFRLVEGGSTRKQSVQN